VNQENDIFEVESLPLSDLAEALRSTLPFAGTPIEHLHAIGNVDRIRAKAGTVLLQPGDDRRFYCVVLEGELRVEQIEHDGSRTVLNSASAGEGLGETPLLIGKTVSTAAVIAVRDTVFLRFTEEDFWNLMACCPGARKVILANMAQRLQAYQVEALHREKLVSLGILAAGLMHELHNPGSAAKRAASQLRQNLLRLQEISLRFSDEPKSHEQMNCMRGLLEQTIKTCAAPAMSSVEQMDAEESMAQFLEAAGVESAYRIAPALVAVGFKQPELECAKTAFPPRSFSDALNWLEALVSSVSLVCTIEESLTRVSDLVMAVKKFAYDDRSGAQALDVHDSIQSTLTILGHKLRMKNISVQKNFAAGPSTLRARGSSLSQVWTNLIDNAVDASPGAAAIEISSWNEPGVLAVSITDHGPGIPPDVLPHIFEPFFTTKPQGSGTGLGLEIVNRIVAQKFAGSIQVDSVPGKTSFIVRLPLETPTATAPPALASSL